MNFGAHADDTVLVKIFEHVVAEIGNISRYLLLSELRISGFGLVLFYMDRRKYVVLYQIFVNEDSVLVVITFPRHEAYENITSERKLSVIGRRTVGKYHALDDLISLLYYRTLIDASALVGSLELEQFVCIALTARHIDSNPVAADVSYDTVVLRHYHNARIVRYLVLHTRADYRSLRFDERNCLTLHVRTHERSRRIVVLKERNERRSDGNELLRRNVHVIDVFCVVFLYILSVTAVNTRSFESAVRGKRLVSLSYDVLVLFVSLKVMHFFGDYTRLFIDLSVRSFDEAVFVDSRISCKRRNKTYVLTFRRLYRTYSSVVSIVDVTYFETCSLSVKTAGSESREFTLMSKLRYRIVMIHELRQLRRTEKFLYYARYRLYIDKRLRSSLLLVVRRIAHSLSYYSLESRDTQSELVGHEFADRTHSSVSEVVDIVDAAETVAKTYIVVDRSYYIFERDVLFDKLLYILLN